MAFIPWGYFAGQRLGRGSKFVLAMFFALLFLAGSIRAIIDREWVALWGSLLLVALCALAAYLNWPDWELKFKKASGPPSKEGQIATKIAEEHFGPYTNHKK